MKDWFITGMSDAQLVKAMEFCEGGASFLSEQSEDCEAAGLLPSLVYGLTVLVDEMQERQTKKDEESNEQG